jgi:hypothetical protein
MKVIPDTPRAPFQRSLLVSSSLVILRFVPLRYFGFVVVIFTNFNIELKIRKLTSHTHTHTKLWAIDISWGMITVLIWKMACIVLFIKRRDDNSPDKEKGLHYSISNTLPMVVITLVHYLCCSCVLVNFGLEIVVVSSCHSQNSGKSNH